MIMIKELDTVVLAKDLKEYQLTRGDVGAVVHVYEGGKAYEVEFVTKGKKAALTLYYNEECWANRSNEMFTWAQKKYFGRNESGTRLCVDQLLRGRL